MKKLLFSLVLTFSLTFIGHTQNECGKCQTDLPDIVVNHSFDGTVYCVHQDVYVYGNVSFVNSEFVIDTDVKITVDNNATLLIRSSHLYSCESMWKGITVKPGGNVIVTGDDKNSSFIEDALVAINFDMENSDHFFDDLLSVDNTIFNKNWISISLSNYSVWYQSTMVYPFSIKNTIFSCRDIPFRPGALVWDNLATVKYPTFSAGTIYPATPNVMSEPYIDESVYSSSNSNAFLKPPHNLGLKKSYAGINLENIGKYDGSFQGILVGTDVGNSENNNANIFDNHINGIYAYNGNLTVYNCTFQKKYPNLSFGAVQSGIYVKGDEIHHNLSVVNPDLMHTPNNAFFDPDYAVRCVNYSNIEVSNADFRSSMDITIFDPANGFNPTASERGVSITSNNYGDKIQIDHNKFYNILFPIIQQADYVFQGQTFIDYNTIGIYPPPAEVDPMYYPANGAVDAGISLNGYSVASTPISSEIQCHNNTISDATNGIGVSALLINKSSIQNNAITLKERIVYDPFGTYIRDGYGILVEGTSTANTYGNIIVNNTVIGDKATATYSVQDTAAIIVKQSDNMAVGCNNVSQAIYGLDFNGSNVPAKVINNIIDPTNSYGFTLDQAGIIGTQGNSTCTSDNDWLFDNGVWATNGNYKTGCFNYSDPVNSKLIVQNTATYNPDGSNAYDLISIPYSSAIGNIITATPLAICPCEEIFGSKGKRYANRVTGKDTSAAERIALGLVSIQSTDAALRLYVMQQQLFTTLKGDTALLNNSGILQNFMAANGNSNFEKLYELGNAVAANDTAKANTIVNTIRSNNQVDDNFKLFYKWLLKNAVAIRSGNTIQLNKNDIYSLSQLCPYKDGTVVYAARGLYNSMVRKHVFFKDACGSQIVLKTSKQKVSYDKVHKISICPNPSSDGSFTIKFNEKIPGHKNILITDIFGRTVFQKAVFKNQFTTIKLKEPSGVYLITITDELTRNRETSQVIIQ